MAQQAFDALQSSRDQFRGNLKALSSGANCAGVGGNEPQGEAVRCRGVRSRKRWTQVDGKVDEAWQRGILTSLSQAVYGQRQPGQSKPA